MKSFVKIFILLCVVVIIAGIFYLSGKDSDGRYIFETNLKKSTKAIAGTLIKKPIKQEVIRSYSEEELASLRAQLMAAVRADDTAQTAKLLKNGAPPDIIENATSATPLFTAVENKNTAIINLLLKYGADPRQVDENALTPLHTAIEENTLGESDNYKGVQIIQTFLDNNISVDLRDLRGRTPLMIASQAHKTETVKFLLSKGADKTLKDYGGRTALDIARKNMCEECAALLKAPVK